MLDRLREGWDNAGWLKLVGEMLNRLRRGGIMLNGSNWWVKC